MGDDETWPQKIADLGLHATIDSLAELYSDGDPPTDAIARAEFNRQRDALTGIKTGLINSTPAMIPAASLSAINSAITSASGQLTNWRSNANDNHINGASAQIDKALIAFAQIPAPSDPVAPQSEVQSLRRSVAQHIAQVDREIAALKERLAESDALIDTKMDTANNNIADTEASIVRLKADAEAALEAARGQVNTQQQAFLNAQERRNSTFSELLDSSLQSAAKASEVLLKETEEHFELANEVAQEELARIEAAQEKVQQILGIVGEQALVGTYQNLAAEEKATANRMRIAAIALTVCTVGFGIWTVATSDSPGSDWDLFASRIALAVPIGAAAGYAGRQSSEHRAAQRRSEDMALKLGALGPFLSDMDHEDRNRVTEQAASQLFGPGVNAPDNDHVDSPATTEQLLPLLKTIVDKL